MQDSLFSGLKVVELAAVLAGPAVGMFLAELGAEVIKIENKKTGGDMTRGWKLPSEDPSSPISAYFCSINWGKKHLILDLDDPVDRQTAFELATQADVVISNMKPSSAARMGMDAQTLRAANDRLIFAQLDAFADPEDERPAFDIVLQAEAGYLYMTGEPDRQPVRMPVAFIDVLAAHQLKEGVLIALWQRERSGKGSTVRVSLMESALASLMNQAANYAMRGHVPQRMGTRHPNIAPYGDMFTCADGASVVLAVGTERQFERLCFCLDMLDLLQNPDFKTNAARVRNREALYVLLEKAIARYELEALMLLFNKEKVPAARIRDMRSVFSLPETQAMILESVAENGEITRCLRTKAFQIS